MGTQLKSMTAVRKTLSLRSQMFGSITFSYLLTERPLAINDDIF
jgi:hypothetical protein